MLRASHRGRLLVASPLLTDPNFDRTVVLVLEDSDDGALGIVLNRPTFVELSDPLPDWAPLATVPEVVFVGGPVAPDAVIALARARDADAGDTPETEAFTPVLGTVGSIDLGRDPFEVGLPIDALRVFTGYTGWGPAQLDNELDEGAWFVCNAEPGDVFAEDPDRLWRAVLRRQRGHLAVFAHFPDDPASN
jgi:putative transcriptional regulator